MLEGAYEEARSQLEESVRLFRRLGAPAGLAMALNTLGDLARVGGDDDGAATYYAEALAMAAEVGFTAQRASCLHNLGYIAHRRGDDRQSREYFREALLLFRDMGDVRGVAECIAGLATVDAERQPERAARLLAAAAAVVETVDGQLYPYNQADYERALQVARGRVSDASFAAAWSEGRAMNVDQAIVHALAAS